MKYEEITTLLDEIIDLTVLAERKADMHIKDINDETKKEELRDAWMLVFMKKNEITELSTANN